MTTTTISRTTTSKKITERERMEIYVWIDRLNLQSKPKKHFARDFSDGVLCAEILMKTTTSVSSSSSRRSNTARMISMHNYPIKNSFKGKLENWELLNAKVLRSPKIRCELTREEMSAVARSEKDAAERVLLKIKTAVEDDFMSLDHPDERDRDREEGGEEESNSETDEYEIEEEEEEEEEEQEEKQNTHKQRLAQSAANDEKNDDEKEKEDKEETKTTTTTTTKRLPLKEATIKEEEEKKNHPRKSSLLSSSVIKEKDEAISRLTVKVDALTAKCAKLEQLLELTKRKAIMLFRVAQGRAPKEKILSFPSEKNENKDAYYHIIVLKDEGSIHDFNGLVHRLLRRRLLSLRGWDYHVEQIHFIGHAVPFSNRPLLLRRRVWMGDDGVAV